MLYNALDARLETCEWVVEHVRRCLQTSPLLVAVLRDAAKPGENML
jgi:hypothetical protein